MEFFGDFEVTSKNVKQLANKAARHFMTLETTQRFSVSIHTKTIFV